LGAKEANVKYVCHFGGYCKNEYSPEYKEVYDYFEGGDDGVTGYAHGRSVRWWNNATYRDDVR
jgi:hypothetical protein